MINFNELGLDARLQRAVAELGFSEATEIQSRAIPVILAGQDLIGRSSTGTGKTAAFGLPCLQRALETEGRSTVLILSPTRELAMQISEELRKFSRYVPGISIATVYGGAAMDNQIRQLRTARIVVGTPGRLLDHLRRRTLKLEELRMVVLDEADEMLNMGFHEDIEAILSCAPAARQTVLFSATMPPAILALAEAFQTDPQMITADGGKKTVDAIDQSYYVIPQAAKLDAVKLLLEYHDPRRALIFCNTKKMVDDLSGELNDSGYRCIGLHGDMKQAQRTAVMNEFKRGRAAILIATDVAARGIDVDDVEAVLNYDIPSDFEYYIHRIGRTGRAGRTGASYTLAANRRQILQLHQLEAYLHTRIEERPIPSVADIRLHHAEKLSQTLREKVESGAGAPWLGLVQQLAAEGLPAEELAAALCANVLQTEDRLAGVHEIAAPGQKKASRPSSNGSIWVRADIGSNDRIAPNFIVGAIVEATGLTSREIGKISIYSDYTDIELTGEAARGVLEEMQGTRIKGRPVNFTALEDAPAAVAPRRAGRGDTRGDTRGRKPYGASRENYGSHRFENGRGKSGRDNRGYRGEGGKPASRAPRKKG